MGIAIIKRRYMENHCVAHEGLPHTYQVRQKKILNKYSNNFDLHTNITNLQRIKHFFRFRCVGYVTEAFSNASTDIRFDLEISQEPTRPDWRRIFADTCAQKVAPLCVSPRPPGEKTVP